MLKKLIVFAITSGLASKAFRALMNRQRTAPASRYTASRNTTPSGSGPGRRGDSHRSDNG